MPPLLRGPLIGRAKWHSRQGPSLQPLVLETNALPIELREYKNRPWNRTSRAYSHAPRSKLRSGGHIALKKPRVCGLGAELTHIRRAMNGTLRIPALLLWKNACDGEKKKPERRYCRWGDGSHASGCCGYSCPALRRDTVESNHNPISGAVGCPFFAGIAHRSIPRNGEGTGKHENPPGGTVSEAAWQASHRFRRFRLYQFYHISHVTTTTTTCKKIT